ncbi:alpha/beta hydrolase [Variovorax robiniae]|uniref:Alpha/beta hydrolase n=1 Tax=Variovorax robiniae TaxID=1836199 RepID=A0ABU8XIM3_9BURK
MLIRLLVNIALRLTLKRLWSKGPTVEALRVKAAAVDAWLRRWFGSFGVEPIRTHGGAAEWVGDASAAKRGVLLYVHGGAFCIHLPNAYRRLASRLAHKTGMRVLMPCYRLAPEHPLPAGLDDCFAAYCWLLDQGIAAERVAIAGDSAGGNLALGVVMRARDEGRALPACAVLMSPVTDLAGTGPSLHTNEMSDVMFSGSALALVQSAYLNGASAKSPSASPLYGEWEGLPPMLFHASGSEMLLDDSRRAVDRARARGVVAHLKVWPGMPHVFQLFSLLPESRQAIDEVGAFIGEHTSLPTEF